MSRSSWLVALVSPQTLPERYHCIITWFWLLWWVIFDFAPSNSP